MMNTATASAYRFHRTNGRPATAALEAAKRDVANGTDRYTDFTGLGAPGDRGGRWTDRPEAIGLRFVGWSDELAGISHTGWFLDSDIQDDVARGCVYATPSRRGVATYIEAIRVGSTDRGGNWTDQNGTDGSAMLFLKASHKGDAGGYNFDASDDKGARDAAYGADREAQIYGERESEYQTAWRAGNDVREELERANLLRFNAVASLRELRHLEREHADRAPMPALCQRLRASVSLDLETARAIYEKARDAWSNEDGFTEGAGFPTFAAARKALRK